MVGFGAERLMGQLQMTQAAIIKPSSTCQTADEEQVSAIVKPCVLPSSLGNCGKQRVSVGDWIESNRSSNRVIPGRKERLPSYSTIRRVLLKLDPPIHCKCLGKFFGISPRQEKQLQWMASCYEALSTR